MSKILNLWLVLQTTDNSLKLVKNSDKFFFGASNTVRERAVLPVESEFDITFDDGIKKFKLLFKSNNEDKCKLYMNQLDENGGCQGFFMKYDDDEFEEFPGMTPSFEIIERELRTLINYGVDFPLESFFRLIRKKFTALFLHDANVGFGVITETIRWTNQFRHVSFKSSLHPVFSFRQILQVVIAEYGSSLSIQAALEDSEDISLWKYCKKTDFLSLGDLDEPFSPDYLYISWKAKTKCLERSGGKIWFKNLQNPKEKIELNKLLVAHLTPKHVFQTQYL